MTRMSASQHRSNVILQWKSHRRTGGRPLRAFKISPWKLVPKQGFQITVVVLKRLREHRGGLFKHRTLLFDLAVRLARFGPEDAVPADALQGLLVRWHR